MKQEYDFSNGARGKYHKRYKAGSNVVVLDPEIAKIFSSSAAVNQALRTLLRAARHNKRLDLTPQKRRKSA